MAGLSAHEMAGHGSGFRSRSGSTCLGFVPKLVLVCETGFEKQFVCDTPNEAHREPTRTGWGAAVAPIL